MVLLVVVVLLIVLVLVMVFVVVVIAVVGVGLLLLYCAGVQAEFYIISYLCLCKFYDTIVIHNEVQKTNTKKS